MDMGTGVGGGTKDLGNCRRQCDAGSRVKSINSKSIKKMSIKKPLAVQDAEECGGQEGSACWRRAPIFALVLHLCDAIPDELNLSACVPRREAFVVEELGRHGTELPRWC